ncbi:MAG: ABC transporter ATP-binding protein [Cyclobacteriaceae bacterium]|nr:ABC transporter ATP-binding protein [Cyclobacteriaceae bacterium]
MIDIIDLHKNFGKLEVLKGISLSIEPGRTTAILGPNGSGKTTLIKCILGLVRPTSGDIRYCNVSVLDRWKYRREMGYLPQIARFPENLTVTELIRFVEDLREQQGNYQPLVHEFELDKNLHKKLRFLSGGTRQKVNLLLTFMFDSPVYILDEPTSGLDPVALLRFKELLARKKNKSRTVIFTTHIMNLVEEISDDLVFLLEGTVYFQGTCRELMSSHQEINLETAIARILSTNNYVENIKV